MDWHDNFYSGLIPLRQFFVSLFECSNKLGGNNQAQHF